MSTNRLSLSAASPTTPTVIPDSEVSEEWIKQWQSKLARDLIDTLIVVVDSESSVEDACAKLLSEDILCLTIKNEALSPAFSYVGLFDFSDVNAFLTVAATRHTHEHEENPRVDQIVQAARAGHVPVHLVSNLSDKNPLQVLPYEATAISLLELFSRGTHRVLIRAAPPSEDFLGMVSDRGLLSWFALYAGQTPSFSQYLSHPLSSLCLPSLNLYSSVVAATSNSTVLDAIKLMSEEGVSSVAVLEDEGGTLLSAVSVTDIGKIVVPSESNQILSTPLHGFISQIKGPVGWTDGADKYPVYSVLPSSLLSYTIEKLLATNAHRLFVTTEPSVPSSPVLSPTYSGNLCGIVSIVDILSLFARIANIPDVDPTRMQRHRRASSASSHSSGDLSDSRSSSRSGLRRNSSHRTPNINIPGARSSIDSTRD